MKILFADKLAQEAVDLAKSKADVETFDGLSEDELLSKIHGVDALIVRSKTKVPASIMDAADRLKYIGRAGTGVDNIEIPAASERGIYVMNTPTANSVSVAELSIGLMLSLLRNLNKADKTMKAGTWAKKQLKGNELFQKTLGLIGFGRIGGLVAERAKAFGMDVVVYDPYITAEIAEKNGAKLFTDLDDLLRASDMISLHVPLTPKTKNMISTEQFKTMKKNAIIINCARGGTIDEAALFDALDSGEIAGAALDVYSQEPPENSPLFSLDNVILTPHLGASTEEAQVRAGTQLVENIFDAIEKKEYRNVVNKELL